MEKLPPYHKSLAGLLLAAREAVMAPIRPMLRDAGVTEQQWRVLRVLDDQNGVDSTTLAELALLFAPSVTRILQELCDRKLVIRRPDPEDRRRFILSLSASGKSLLKNTSQHTVPFFQGYADRFGHVRLERLMSELDEFARIISSEWRVDQSGRMRKPAKPVAILRAGLAPGQRSRA